MDCASALQPAGVSLYVRHTLCGLVILPALRIGVGLSLLRIAL